MFLQRTETASDDTILDYLARPLFAAAVGTTQYGLQSMMYFIVASKSTLIKVRHEFEENFMEKHIK